MRIIWLSYISREKKTHINGWAEAGVRSTTVALFSLSASSTVSWYAEIAYRLRCGVFIKNGCM